MSDPGFKVEGRHHGAPFRPRDTFFDYYSFGSDDYIVLVHPSTAQDMRRAAKDALPDETGGLLSGRAMRDDAGQYMIVSGFIEAEPNAGQVMTVNITPGEMGALRTQAARANPGAEEVGWWHSHTWPSPYSSTDRNTQRMFERPDSVGILVFAEGKEWAAAYVGPESRDLGYLSRPPAGSTTAPVGAAESAGRTIVPANAQDQDAHQDGIAISAADPPGKPPSRRFLAIPSPPATRRPLSGQQLLGIVLAVSIVAAVTSIVAVLLAIFDVPAQVSNLQQSLSKQMTTQLRQLSNQVASQAKPSVAPSSATASPTAASPVTSSPAAAASVSWFCVHKAWTSYQCTATSSPGTTGKGWIVWWVVNGKRIGKGRTQVPLGIDKTAKVQAILLSPAGKVYTGQVRTLSP